MALAAIDSEQHTSHGIPSAHGSADRAPSYLDAITARDIMTPGVVTIVEEASLKSAFNALTAHEVHAVLVVGRQFGRPLGWVTGRGLLGRLEDDAGLIRVADAITEQPVWVHPGASAREVMIALSQAGVSHVLVCHGQGMLPEGVISELDLLRLAGL